MSNPEPITPEKILHAIEVLLAEAYPLANSFRWDREEGPGDALTLQVTADTGQSFGLRDDGVGAERRILAALLRGAVARASLRMTVDGGEGGRVSLAEHCARHGWPGARPASTPGAANAA